jgi:hypothetical protein
MKEEQYSRKACRNRKASKEVRRKFPAPVPSPPGEEAKFFIQGKEGELVTDWQT